MIAQLTHDVSGILSVDNLLSEFESLPTPPRSGVSEISTWFEDHRFLRLLEADAGTLSVARTYLAYHSPLADSIFAVHGLCSRTLQNGNSRHLATLSARSLGAFALTESGAGSDARAVSCNAQTVDGGYVLTGTKSFVSNAPVAVGCVCFAQVDGGSSSSVSAFWVPFDANGIEVEELDAGDHIIGSVNFLSVELDESSLVGGVGQGMSLAFETLGVFRATVGASAIGMAMRAFDEAINHTSNRSQFGKKLIAIESLQNELAEIFAKLELAKSLLWRTVHRQVNGKSTASDVSLAKWQCTELAQQIIDGCLQLHGGLGILEDSVVQQLYLAIRPQRIYEGTSEIQRRIVGRAIAKRFK